jgi:micrococcal nuclease
MKTIRITVSILIVLSALALYVINDEGVADVYDGGRVATVADTKAPTVTVVPEFFPTPTPPHDEGTITTVHGERAYVARVIDGDTIELADGERVRYIGINTPESVDPRRPVQCFGKEASAYNKELVQGEWVELETDITNRDKYGRLLRYIWLGDVLINEQLLRDGYAQVKTYPPDVKYVDRYRVAQTEAREAGRGLWHACRDE